MAEDGDLESWLLQAMAFSLGRGWGWADVRVCSEDPARPIIVFSRPTNLTALLTSMYVP